MSPAPEQAATPTAEDLAVHARIEKLEPLRAIVDDPTFAAQLAGLRELRADFLDDPLFPHISGLLTIGENLTAALAKEPAAPAAPGEGQS